MVLCNNLSPTEALKNFSDARGHRIERENYIEGIESHGKNELLKQKVQQFEPPSKKKKKVKYSGGQPTARSDSLARRGFSTHAAGSRNAPPRRNETDRNNWRSHRQDYSQDRGLPDDNRFHWYPHDSSQIARGELRSRRGGYSHNHNTDPYPRNSNSRNKSSERLRGAGNPGPSYSQGGQYQNYADWRNRTAQTRDYNLHQEGRPSNDHPNSEGWMSGFRKG